MATGLLTSIFLAILVVYTHARSASPLYGTNTGTSFKDGGSFTALTAVRVYSGWVIDGIQAQYLNANNNRLVWMPFHGTKTQFAEIHVAYPYERFVYAKGKYGPYSSEAQQGVTVTELSLVTYNNITGKMLTYGPYGGHETTGQTGFQTADGSEIVSIYGFFSDYMRGLGFVLETFNYTV